MPTRPLLTLLLLLTAALVRPAAAQTVGESWTQANGPVGGDVRHLAVDAQGRLWAGSAAGLYASVSGEPAWRKLNRTPFDFRAVRRVLPRAGGSLLVLTGDSLFLGSENGGWRVPVSVGGWAWADAWTGGCWALTQAGQLWRANASAQDWQAADLPPGLDRAVSLFVQPDGGVWVGAEDTLRVWFLPAGGEGWREASEGLLPDGDWEAPAAWAAANDTLYIGTRNHQLFARALNAETWEVRAAANPSAGAITALTAADGRLFSGTDRGVVRRSADGGRTWRAIFSLPSSDSIYTILQHAGRVFVGAYRSGCIELHGDADRSPRNIGLIATAPELVAWAGDSALVTAVRDVGLFRSLDAGQSWETASAGIGGTQYLDLTTGGGRLWAAVLGADKVYVSRDSARSWEGIGRSLPDFGANCLVWRQNEFDSRLYAGTTRQGVHYWSGFDWKALPQVGLPSPSIQQLAVDLEGRLLAYVSGEGVYEYQEDVERWTPRNLGLATTLVQGLYAGAGFDSLYAAAGDQLFVWRGEAGWASLRQFEGGSPTDPVYVTGVAQDSAGTLFVATKGLGIHAARIDSATGARVWEPYMDGLRNPRILDLKMGPKGWLAATTEGDGLFLRRPWASTDTVIDRKPGRMARAFLLYPNPARDRVWLRLPEGGGAPLDAELHDLQGRLVFHWRRVLPAGGDYVLRLPEELPAGLYVLTIGEGHGQTLWVVGP